MTKENIYLALCHIVPTFAKEVERYEKIGSQSIRLKMKNGKTRVFLYYNDDNWTLGTKSWRKRPERTPKKTKHNIVAS